MQTTLIETEWELISIIRNYKKTYPRSTELELFIEYLVDKLME